MACTAVGIDLGTTYSCVGVWRNDRVEIITNDQGNRTTPSYVAFSDERLVGEAAYNQAPMNPENTVFDSKRLIGRKWSDEVVQKDRMLWPFKVIQKAGDRPAIQVTLKGETVEFFPEEISAMVLSKLKQDASNFLGTEVTEAVVTVPAYFSDSQRVSTKDAGAIAGLNVLRIINEPTAAAMAYGLDKRGDEQNIMIYDFGGGTLDCTIVSVYNGVFEVKATGGDTHLGGEDIDNILVEHFRQEFKRKFKHDIISNQRSIRRLRTACERLKRTLSTAAQANLEIDALYEGVDFYTKITRARFNELCNDLFLRCMQPLSSVLSDSKLSKKNIHEVVLVGGSTRIPRIQELITQFFDGKEPCKSINPDEAIAYGAAIQAAILSGKATGAASECLLIDVTPLSLGVESSGGVMAPIIPKNTTIPVTKSKTFSTNHDNQESVKIKIFEGERPLTRDNHCLGTFEMHNIPPMPRASPRIEVTFELDANGILTVRAEEKGSGKQSSLTITNDQGRLTPEQIEAMLAQAKAFEEEDKVRAELLDWRNSLENYAFNIKSRLGEHAFNELLTDDERQSLSSHAEQALTWLDDNDAPPLAELQEQLKTLEHIYGPVVAAVTTRQQEKEAAANPPPATSEETPSE